ncbi:MFS transporter [Kitasatospora sp. NBC_01539]|uniref:MFS transporter n=1 Tax=Kitasatospora sp. NBC_01539 TaxID=2903577 RepID=UPI003860206D
MADDLHAARRARVGVSLVFAVHGAVTGTFATRIPWIQDHTGVGPGQLGLALLAPAVGSFLAMPLAGRIVHRFGARAAVRGLLMLWTMSLALPALAPNLGLLWLSLFVYGASAGMSDVAMNAQGVEVESRLDRSIMSGLHGLWYVGGLAASGFGVLAAHLGVDPRLHYAVVALILTCLGYGVSGLLLDVRPAAGEEAPPRFALPPRAALLIGLVGFCGVFAEGASVDWSGVYIKAVTGSSAGTAAACYAVFAATMAVVRLAGDHVVDRLGPVRTVRLGGTVATAGGLLVVFARTPYLAIPGFALIGLGVAVVVPLAFAAAGRAGGNASQAIAGVATVTYTSGLVAPAIVGGIAQISSLTVSFAVVTLMAAALVPSAGVLGRRRRTAPTAGAPAGSTTRRPAGTRAD